ncbi:response regulator transcription factor [Microbispora triticiradicis]|uniref:response regulator transcription factor n=1 Tax=Microbispora triticiradicis TaxID=2200763 RepID=UPI001AD81E2B|nr:response regulator transcription factor [Microbispora triticiradicis]
MNTAAATTREVVELMLEVPQGKVVSYDLAALCSALDITDSTRITVETDGSRRAIVTIYPSNPLAEVRAVTREDLVMGRHGRIVTGVYHNGRPAKKRLFDPSTGSAQRFLTFGTTGAGKSRALQIELAAEKINGIVTWLADLKEGQSVPEAKGNVDFYGSSQEAAILILRAGCAHKTHLLRIYAKLDVRDRASAVAEAYRRGLLS